LGKQLDRLPPRLPTPRAAWSITAKRPPSRRQLGGAAGVTISGRGGVLEEEGGGGWLQGHAQSGRWVGGVCTLGNGDSASPLNRGPGEPCCLPFPAMTRRPDSGRWRLRCSGLPMPASRVANVCQSPPPPGSDCRSVTTTVTPLAGAGAADSGHRFAAIAHFARGASSSAQVASRPPAALQRPSRKYSETRTKCLRFWTPYRGDREMLPIGIHLIWKRSLDSLSYEEVPMFAMLNSLYSP